jgi:hypothetical protein
MAVARAKGRLGGHQPKLSTKQRAELRGMPATGDYSITPGVHEDRSNTAVVSSRLV